MWPECQRWPEIWWDKLLISNFIMCKVLLFLAVLMEVWKIDVPVEGAFCIGVSGWLVYFTSLMNSISFSAWKFWCCLQLWLLYDSKQNISSFLNFVLTTKGTINVRFPDYLSYVSLMHRNHFSRSKNDSQERLNSCLVTWFRITRFSAQMCMSFQTLGDP